MPIYEYLCGKCGEISEALVFGEEELKACQSCGGSNLTKVMSAHNTASGTPPVATQACGSCCGSPSSCGMPGSCCSN